MKENNWFDPFYIQSHLSEEESNIQNNVRNFCNNEEIKLIIIVTIIKINHYVNFNNLVGKARIVFFSNDKNEGYFLQFWKWPKSIRYDRIFAKIK